MDNISAGESAETETLLIPSLKLASKKYRQKVDSIKREKDRAREEENIEM